MNQDDAISYCKAFWAWKLRYSDEEPDFTRFNLTEREAGRLECQCQAEMDRARLADVKRTKWSPGKGQEKLDL